MPIRKLAALSALLVCTSLPLALTAQQPRAITTDPPPNPSARTQNIETVLDSHGSHIEGMLMLASGRQPHRTVILLHGFPGYEQNLDLAQSLRRDGFNVLAVHYRGSWGSQGTFSFTDCMEDISTMLDYLTTPANAQKFHVDTHRIVVVGHSMGGFLTVAALAQHPQIAAAVIISGASPVRDADDYFGTGYTPSDYAPLANTSRAALAHEAQSHTTDWRFESFAAQIAAVHPERPILILSANDGLRDSNEALVAAVKHSGSPVTYQHFDTDHGFSDHRIALQAAILTWLDKTVR